MFDDIPDNYKPQTASDPEEGWRYTQGDKSARRPPELLTRDHVARCINREVKAGRGSPHGGVFLDIAWIKEKISDAEGHIKRKLPSMYHQFKELADLDITKEPMEVGPTTHYIMGGIRVNADTQESTIPGLFAAGECAAGINGANRLGGNSLSDLIVFGKRAGEYAARAREEGHGAEGRRRRGRSRDEGVAGAVRSRRRRARIPTRCSTICRTRCRRSSASSASKAKCRRRSRRSGRLQRARVARRHRRPSRIQRRLAHLHRSAQPARRRRRRSRARRSSARKAAAVTSATTSRTRRTSSRRSTSAPSARRTAR